MDTVTPVPPGVSLAPEPSIGVGALLARHGRAGAPLVLDVRREAAYAASDVRIAGALRCAPESIADAPAWLPHSADVVCACVHGHEVSRDAAAMLRGLGVRARRLDGGVESWRAAGGPVRRSDAPLRVPPTGGSVWVTRARPKVDRIACPWLVRRFVDPLARIVYLPVDAVLPFAARTGAIAFDLPGGAITHDGERCSFDMLLEAAGLADIALQRLAVIVRGADTDRPGLAPQAAGLLAASLGLSSLHGSDDDAMLEAGMTLYDALYAWCRDAAGETHAWAPEAAR
jgi:rhodanese-related sulfurtransferase